jgi:hypothetical protein
VLPDQIGDAVVAEDEEGLFTEDARESQDVPDLTTRSPRPGLPLLFSTDGMLLRRVVKPESLQIAPAQSE